LAITNNLRYTAELYLLEPEEYLAYITPSPFDYQEQSRIVIPTDIVDYSQVGEEKYTAMIIESLTEVLTSVEGGVLVLFTSYAMLNKVYFALKKKPELTKLNILAHGPQILEL
jgi:ATP-dependent DNA helicase DinG